MSVHVDEQVLQQIGEINGDAGTLQYSGPMDLGKSVGQAPVMNLTIDPEFDSNALAVLAPKNNSAQLAKLEQARQMLAECRTLSEVKQIRDIAEAAKVYAKAANLGHEAQNYAAEIALLAARKAGEILQQLDRKPGQRTDKPAASVAGGSEYSKTLEETSTPERTAQRWQEIAAIPQETFTAYFESATPAQDITAAGLLKATKPHVEKRKNRNEPIDSFEEVRAIAIKMLNIGLREMRKTEANHSLLDSAKTWAQYRLEEKL